MELSLPWTDEWGEMLSTSSNELWLCVQVEAEDLEEDNGTVEEEFDGECP